MRKAILFSLCLLASQRAFAQATVTLNGTLKDYKDRPVTNTEIAVRGDAFSATKADGRFAIAVSNQYQPGQTLTLLVKKAGWIINEPVDGHWNLPSAEYFAKQSLPVTIVPKGSLALLSPARLNEQISRIREELTRKLNEAHQQNRNLAVRDAEIAALKAQVMSGLLRRWEKDYGLTVAKMEEVISQYARTVNPADDDYTKGLKAYHNGNFGEAADLLHKSGNAAAEIAKQAALMAFNSYKAEGDSHSALNKYDRAVAAYDRAADFVTMKQRPQDWAALEISRGNARQEFGIRTESVPAQQLLAESVQHYRNALTVYTNDQLPQQWAMTQNYLGVVLRSQGDRVPGPEGEHLWDEAVVALQAALNVRKREEFLQEWAETKINFGIVLISQGGRLAVQEKESDKQKGVQLFSKAVAVFREVLDVRTRRELPQPWATAQHYLGNALLRQGEHTPGQGEHTPGQEGVRLLGEAEDAYRKALDVRTRKELSQDWAGTKNSLGVALSFHGEKAEGQERVRLLGEAVAAFGEALEVRTRDDLPQLWAATQKNLGYALMRQGEPTPGQVDVQLLGKAVTAFDEALKVNTPGLQPWAATHSDRAEALYLLKDWANAADSYRNVLSVYPNNKVAYDQLSRIYPDDLTALSNFAERSFTTGNLATAETRLAALIANPKLDANTQTALRVIEIANALALGKAESVKPKLAALIAAVAPQPADFRVGWSFNGTLHFIGTHEPLAARRDWLRQLITALQADNRDALLTALRAAEKQFKP